MKVKRLTCLAALMNFSRDEFQFTEDRTLENFGSIWNFDHTIQPHF